MFNFRLKLTDRKTTRYVARGEITKNIEERADLSNLGSVV